MVTARDYHTAVLLKDGNVLLAGGETNGVTIAAAELFDSATAKLTAAGSMESQRIYQTMTLLGSSGVVLVTGGLLGGPAQASVELYQ